MLTGFKELKICTHYTLDGEILDGDQPCTLPELERCIPEYITMPGWEEDLSSCKEFAELPENARKYCEKIEEILDIPVVWIGVGPDREQ